MQIKTIKTQQILVREKVKISAGFFDALGIIIQCRVKRNHAVKMNGIRKYIKLWDGGEFGPTVK